MKKLFVALLFTIPSIAKGQVIDGLWTLDKVEIRDSSMITGKEIRRDASEDEIAGKSEIVRMMSIKGNNCMINGQNFRYSIEGNKFNAFALRPNTPPPTPPPPPPANLPPGAPTPPPAPIQPAQFDEQNAATMRSYDYAFEAGQITLSLASFTNRGGPVKSIVSMKLKKL